MTEVGDVVQVMLREERVAGVIAEHVRTFGGDFRVQFLEPFQWLDTTDAKGFPVVHYYYGGYYYGHEFLGEEEEQDEGDSGIGRDASEAQ